ncbi:hypothetical protein VTL71DRAFT_6656 [Oculimacula yallundae]|uniref:Uncharacterized protein n=1 Tax=Oculimacula yallundae TaxID=86028 RepID=A0ABR4BXR1_9HELO
MANQSPFTFPSGGGFSFAAPGPSFLQSKHDALQSKYEELEKKFVDLQTNLGDTQYTLQKRISAHDFAIAEKTSAVDAKEAAERELATAHRVLNGAIRSMNAMEFAIATMVELPEPDEEEIGPLSHDESSDESDASDTSYESEEPYSTHDGGTQTDEDSEAALIKKNMDQKIADLEKELDETRKERNKLASDRQTDLDYIDRAETSQQEAVQAQEKAEATTADYKVQVDALKKQEKENDKHITAMEKKLSNQMETNELDKKEAQRFLEHNEFLKEKLAASEALVQWYKDEADKIVVQSSAVLKQEKKFKQENTTQKSEIDSLGDQIKESAHFAPDLFRHQAILETALAQINETMDEIPPLQLHPEAYEAPAGVPAASANLGDELEDLTFGSSSELSSEDGIDADGTAADGGENDQEAEADELFGYTSDESSTSAPLEIEDDGEDENITITVDPIEIEKVISEATVTRFEVEVPVVVEVETEEGGPAPGPTGPAPAVPGAVVYLPGPVVTVPGPVVYVPGPAPAPVIITQTQDRYFYFERPVHSWLHVERDFTILLAALFANTFGIFFPWIVQEIRGVAPITFDPIPVRFDYNAQDPAAGTQGVAGPADGDAPGSDPSDQTFGPLGSPGEAPDLSNMLGPLTPSPDNREGIPPGPQSSPKPAGNGFAAPIIDAGAPPPPPPIVTAEPGFWDIFATRPLPGIWSTLLLLLLHLVVYYFVYISFSTYYERNLWLAANDATRAYLHSIMGLRYTDGMLRKMFSESWAGGIDVSLVRILTYTGLFQVQAFKMAG